jgi:hypothetical protein
MAVRRGSRDSDLAQCGNGGGDKHTENTEESEPTKHCCLLSSAELVGYLASKRNTPMSGRNINMVDSRTQIAMMEMILLNQNDAGTA